MRLSKPLQGKLLFQFSVISDSAGSSSADDHPLTCLTEMYVHCCGKRGLIRRQRKAKKERKEERKKERKRDVPSQGIRKE